MASSQIPPNIQATTNPILLGYLLNWGLYGALGVQVYVYYLSFPSDPTYSKYLVLGLFILETGQTALITQDVFVRFGLGYGNVDALRRMQLFWLSVPVWSAIVSSSIQLYFAHRITKLSTSKCWGLIIATVAVMQASAGFVQGFQAHKAGELALLHKTAFLSCAVWVAGSAVCDVLIAISMTYYLATRDTHFHGTRDLLNRLIRLTVETGSLTAAMSTLHIILFFAFPNNDYHITPGLMLAKLYSNTLLVILNSRVRIEGGRQDVHSHARSGEQTSSHRNLPFRINHRAKEPVAVNGISVRTEYWRENIPLEDLEGVEQRNMKVNKDNAIA